MTVRISKPEFNLREKLSELDKPTGLKGLDLMRSDTTQDVRTFISSGRKNLVINGQFDIWQRATDSGSNTSDGYLTADRWFHASSGATKQVTRQSFSTGQTDVPDNPKYYLRYAVTTGNNNVAIRQRIEDVTRVQGEMTFSFWVKGSNPGGGNFNLTFRQNFGSGGSASSVVDQGISDYTVTNTWTKKTFTFTPTSISGKTIGTTEGTSYYEIELFRQPNGDNSTAAFTVDFANVQLERGGNATEFDHRSFGEELALCERYFQSNFPLFVPPQNAYYNTTSNLAAGFNGVVCFSGSNARSPWVMFNQKMNHQPDVTLYSASTSDDANKWSAYKGSWDSGSSNSIDYFGNQGFGVRFGSGGHSFVIGEAYLYRGMWAADAEL